MVLNQKAFFKHKLFLDQNLGLTNLDFDTEDQVLLTIKMIKPTNLNLSLIWISDIMQVVVLYQINEMTCKENIPEWFYFTNL